MAIKVILVDDIKKTLDNLSKLIEFEDDIEVIATAQDGEEAVEKTKKLQPDVVIMDINMPKMDGIQAAEILAQECPGSPVIIMSVQGEKDYLRRAMQAGAREFLIKPFSADELTDAIRRVHTLEQKRSSIQAGPSGSATGGGSHKKNLADIYTIISGKGGVGKSLVAANLAIALAKETGSKVCLVDANLQFGDVNVLLNINHPRTFVDLADADKGLDDEVMSEVLADGPAGIKVMLAPPSPELADSISIDAFLAVLEHLQGMFDYIIVDTATSIGDLFLQTISLSKKLIVVGQVSIPALKNTALMLRTLEALDISKEDILVVMTHLETTTELTIAQVEQTLSHAVAVQMPYEPRIVNHSLNRGLAFVERSPEAEVSRSIRELVQCLVNRPLSDISTTPSTNESKQKKKGLFGLGRK